MTAHEKENGVEIDMGKRKKQSSTLVTFSHLRRALVGCLHEPGPAARRDVDGLLCTGGEWPCSCEKITQPTTTASHSKKRDASNQNQPSTQPIHRPSNHQTPLKIHSSHSKTQHTGVGLDVLVDDRVGLLGRPPPGLEVVAGDAGVGAGLLFCGVGRVGR